MDKDAARLNIIKDLQETINIIHREYLNKVKENIRLKHKLKELLLSQKTEPQARILSIHNEIKLPNFLHIIDDIDI